MPTCNACPATSAMSAEGTPASARGRRPWARPARETKSASPEAATIRITSASRDMERDQGESIAMPTCNACPATSAMSAEGTPASARGRRPWARPARETKSASPEAATIRITSASRGMGEGSRGEYCNADVQCAPGDFCNVPIGGYSGVCDGWRLVGELCTRNAECQSGGCDNRDLVCFPQNGQGVRGEYCSTHAQCAPGDFCDVGSDGYGGVCSGPKLVGEACASNGECQSGGCDNVDLVCFPQNGQGVRGKYCNAHAQCAPGDFCDVGSDGYGGVCAD